MTLFQLVDAIGPEPRRKWLLAGKKVGYSIEMQGLIQCGQRFFYGLIKVVLQLHPHLAGASVCPISVILADPMRGAGCRNRPTMFSVVINKISTAKVIKFNFH